MHLHHLHHLHSHLHVHVHHTLVHAVSTATATTPCACVHTHQVRLNAAPGEEDPLRHHMHRFYSRHCTNIMTENAALHFPGTATAGAASS